VDGLQGGTEQQRRLFFAGGPANFTIDALPVHVELSIDQDDGFGALTPRTRDAVLIENFGKADASSHTSFVGRVLQTD
jgi:hypothetical protein